MFFDHIVITSRSAGRVFALRRNRCRRIRMKYTGAAMFLLTHGGPPVPLQELLRRLRVIGFMFTPRGRRRLARALSKIYGTTVQAVDPASPPAAAPRQHGAQGEPATGDGLCRHETPARRRCPEEARA